MVFLDSTAAGNVGSYINCFDGAAQDFAVKLHGEVEIAGNASADMITVTAGDVQLTAGDIDLDNGQLMVDSAQDLANNITRNFAGAGTGPVLTVKDDNTSTTNVALLVESDGTGASTALQISHDGDSPAIDIDAGAARTGDVIDVAMANMLAERALNVTGAITGASGEGVIEVHATGNMADGASLVRLDTDTGTPVGTTAGFAINIDDDSGALADAYAVLINSANNEGLNVASGKALFAEQATFTAGIDSDGSLDVDFSANTELANVTSTAADYAAGSGVITVYDDSTGQTNASYLIRGAREANGDAQDGFLLFEDNSTGAAGNGDDMFAINADGDVVMGGASGTGGRMIYSFEDLTIDNAGTAASVEVVTTFITTDGDGNEDNATLADGTKGQVKKFVSVVEGAGADTWKITPANMNGGSKISFDGAVGDSCVLMFDGTSWNVESTNGGTIS